MIDVLNLLSEKWLELMWRVTWQGSVFIGLIFLITRIFRRLSPTIKHLLWMLVIVKLLIMPFVTVPIAPPAFPTIVNKPPVKSVTETPVVPRESGVISETSPVLPSDELPLALNASHPGAAFQLPSVLFSVWLCGIIILIFGITFRSIRLKKDISKARVLEDKDVLNIVTEGVNELRIRPPILKISDKFKSPLACGIVRPVIIFPEHIIEKFTESELRAIIYHELAHIKRKDILTNWFQILTQILYFLNPLVWYANRQIRIEREQACDDWVLEGGKEERKSYADALLKVVEICSVRERFTLGIVGVSETFTLMARRVKMIMDSGRKINTRLSVKLMIGFALIGVMVIPTYAGKRPSTMGSTASPVETERYAYTVVRDWERGLLAEVWMVQPGKQPRHIKTYLGNVDVSSLPESDKFLVQVRSIIRAHFGDNPYGHAGSPIIDTTNQSLNIAGLEDVINFPVGYDPLYTEPSPDGTRIVFNGHQKLSDGSLDLGVWVSDLKYTEVKKLFNGSIKTLPKWSPDSKFLVIADGKGYTQRYTLKIVNVLTGEVTDIGIDGVGPDWSPDGSWLAYSGDIIRGGSWFRGIPVDGSIFKYNLKSKVVKYLTDKAVHTYDKESDRREISGALMPQWSPDGKKILYMRRLIEWVKREKKQDLTEVWVMDSEGENKRKLFSEHAECMWTTEGTSIMAKAKDAVWRIDVLSGEREKVVDLTGVETKLEPQEEKGLQKAASFIAEAVGHYVQAEDLRMKNELTNAREHYEEAIKNFRRISVECPKAKISQDNCLAYIKKLEQLKAVNSEENAEKVCEYHMNFMGSRLQRFVKEHKDQYPENLESLLEWSLGQSWQYNEIKSTHIDKVIAMFHCVADSDSTNGGNYNYTQIAADAPDGTPVLSCKRHPGEIIMLIKSGERYKVVMQDM